MTEAYRFGAFRLLPQQRELLMSGSPVELGTRGFDLLVALMIFVALTEKACAGPLGAAAIVVLCPLSLLGLFTFGWSLVAVVAPRAVDDEAPGEGNSDDA